MQPLPRQHQSVPLQCLYLQLALLAVATLLQRLTMMTTLGILAKQSLRQSQQLPQRRWPKQLKLHHQHLHQQQPPQQPLQLTQICWRCREGTSCRLCWMRGR